MLDRLGVSTDASVIDVGGGASRLVDRLLERGHTDVTVLDIAAHSLTIARHRLGDRAVKVRWLTADVRSWRPDRTFEVWHDRAVFHFLVTDDDRRSYLDVLRTAVPVGGFVIMATFALDGPEQCSGLPVVRYDPLSLVAVLGEGFTIHIAESQLHATPWGAHQPFTWVGATRT
jgi:SAM-dependent methyltransferase